MKKICGLLFLMVTLASNAQHDIKFTDGSFKEILEQAKSENKPVFYMFYAKWCSHCNKMKADVFTDSVVANFYNNNFINAKQDMESGEGVALRKKFNVKSYPVLVYFSPNGEVVNRVSNELNASTLVTEGKNALDPEKQLTTLRDKFLSDVGNADKCLAYILALRKGLADANESASKYLATQTDAQMVTATNWRIIANGISDINSKAFQYVVANQKEFATVSSPKRVEKKIIYVVTETLNPLVEATDTIGYFKNRQAVAAIQLAKTDSIVFSSDLKIYENTKNWKAYQKTASASVKKLAWNNPGLLKEIGKIYVKNITDKVALEEALTWAERSLELVAVYDVYVLVAKLNLKLNHIPEAKSFAKKAREMALAYQWNTQEADDVLSQIK